MRRILTAAAATAAIIAAAATVPALADSHMESRGIADSLASVLSDARRADDRGRDQYRHPAETLAFFRVEPGMKVVDVIPGGGWYSRVLVPYLGNSGRYVGMNPDMSYTKSEQMAERWGGMAQKFSGQLGEWGLSGMNATGANLDDLGEDRNGSMDRVLIFREMHNLHRLGLMHSTLAGAYRLLDDDGMLGIVQHRAKETAPAGYTDGSKGYLRQKDVIGLVEAHGFELVDTSEINANPRDTADHAGGVWEMQPSWSNKNPALKDLGESDRMTLLFRKRA